MTLITSTSFDHLTSEQLYKVLKLRQDVFIIEQDCIYEDIDNLDQQSIHLLLMDGEKLAAYSRIVPADVKYSEPSIGRIISSSDYRRKGLGREIVQHSLNFLRDRGESVARIEAQAHLQDFYSSFGFEPEGEIYDLDGIPHIEMLIHL
ncbi:MAG: GNAT family N-acetyltransferase [Balneolaceae bacterium]|nr:GNAT family N-acetyltransferase [Balneolaceae bacterium]MCH8548375.1 GNAT family N-acetyltransferase [Balneolaceae bacterium]